METKIWRTLGKAYYWGQGWWGKQGQLFIFFIVKIPGETRGLDIFKSLSHILTKKDSYRTCLWHPNMHTLSKITEQPILLGASVSAASDILSSAFLLLRNLFFFMMLFQLCRMLALSVDVHGVLTHLSVRFRFAFIFGGFSCFICWF